jgi:hypothetical protein
MAYKRKTFTINGKRYQMTKKVINEMFTCTQKCTNKCDACAFLKIKVLRREENGESEPNF